MVSVFANRNKLGQPWGWPSICIFYRHTLYRMLLYLARLNTPMYNLEYISADSFVLAHSTCVSTYHVFVLKAEISVIIYGEFL